MENYYLNKKLVGKFDGTTYYKEVNKSKHFLKRFSAWAVEKEIVDDLLDKGCEQVEIYEKEGHDVYKISLDDFVKHGDTINFTSEQTMVMARYFDKSKVKLVPPTF